jgi:hypothetical protein
MPTSGAVRSDFQSLAGIESRAAFALPVVARLVSDVLAKEPTVNAAGRSWEVSAVDPAALTGAASDIAATKRRFIETPARLQGSTVAMTDAYKE